MSDSPGGQKRRNRAAATKKTTRGAKSKQPKAQPHVCRAPGCGKVCRSAGGLKSHERQAHPPAAAHEESPIEAVERLLSTMEITPRLAVPAAQARELAKALQECDLTDKAKTSKELTALLRDLLADVAVEPEGGNWTEDES